MTKAQRLQLEASEKRQRLNDLLGLDDLTDEQRGELSTLTTRMQQLEVETRAAIVAESDLETRALADQPDAQMRERLELRSRASLTNYLLAALRGQQVGGAELELRDAAGLEPGGGIPIELFDTALEKRADSLAPSTGTGVMVDRIAPAIFARAVLPRLGVAMPSVPSGTYSTMTITTDLTAAPVAAGAAYVAGAAVLTPKTTSPHRITGRLSLRIEDIATIGTDQFEAMLRQNLSLVMSDALDKAGLTGDGSDPNPEGLYTGLSTTQADPSDVADFGAFVAGLAAGIDGGPWAETMKEVRMLVNAETMRLAETTFQDGSGAQATPGEMSAAAYLRNQTAGFMASSRMPATAATIATGILYRAGTMGLDGVNAMRAAVCPVWAEVGVDDIYTDSASGIRHFTLHSLIGDVLVEQASAYSLYKYKVAT